MTTESWLPNGNHAKRRCCQTATTPSAVCPSNHEDKQPRFGANRGCRNSIFSISKILKILKIPRGRFGANRGCQTSPGRSRGLPSPLRRATKPQSSAEHRAGPRHRAGREPFRGRDGSMRNPILQSPILRNPILQNPILRPRRRLRTFHRARQAAVIIAGRRLAPLSSGRSGAPTAP